jgi:hypothetical protein
LDDDYKLENLLSDAIQDKKLFDIAEKKHVLILDDKILNSEESFYYLINNFYNAEIFDENSKIHLKLKMNLKDFIIISNFLYPTFIKFK